MRTLTFTFLAFVMAAGAGCGKKEAHDEAAPTASAAATPSAVVAPPSPSKEVEAPKAKVELEIASVGNTMTFDKTALTVPTGAEVHLTFKNNSTVVTLPHNWVLVSVGTEASVAAAGLKYGDKAGYIDIADHDILVHTPLAKPGESDCQHWRENRYGDQWTDHILASLT